MNDYEIKEAFKSEPASDVMPDDTLKCSMISNATAVVIPPMDLCAGIETALV